MTKQTPKTYCWFVGLLLVLLVGGYGNNIIGHAAPVLLVAAFSSPPSLILLKEIRTTTTTAATRGFPVTAPFSSKAITPTATTSSLFFFRSNKQQQEPPEDEERDGSSSTDAQGVPLPEVNADAEGAALVDEGSSGDDDDDDDDDSTKAGFRASLARRFFRNKEDGDSSNDADIDAAVEAPTTTAVAVKEEDDDDDSPKAQAERFRAQAERVRLEAERMDAELTLEKIARLEQELETRKRKKIKEGESSDDDDDDDDDDDLRRQMEALQNKLLGKGNEEKKVETTAASVRSSTTPSSVSTGSTDSESEVLAFPTLDEEKLKALEEAPAFLKKALASVLELEYTDEVNVTELALRIEGTSKIPPPTFTQDQIEKRVQELRTDNSTLIQLLSESPAVADNVTFMNDTEIALLSLEYEYTNKQEEMNMIAQGFRDAEEEFIIQPTIQVLDDLLNRSAVDDTIESLYPKCTRIDARDDDAAMGQQLPTEAQVKQLCDTILPKASFSPTSRPEPVFGGYVIRGKYTNKKADTESTGGDDLIESIAELLDKSPSLSNKMNVLYANDFTVFSDPDAYETYDPADAPPILYVIGPDAVRKPQRFLLSITTAIGLATSWYLSIYPFLLNPTISKRVEEELAVASALTSTSSQAPDLSWLAELSVPLFISFVGVQLAHEFAHLVVAGANKVKLSVPTFVPSIITGITSSVTSFKELPKNKQAMFDVSVAGPLIGMLVSALLIAVGSQLTLTSDPALLPALPLEILRQSTLGGGIINGILGNGALSVPEGAVGTAAVAGITIPLHPLAVAGYISLVVNSLAMLPVGTTDGGRVALALFGRGAKLLVGNLFLAAIFLVGLIGSDLFLFYFAFCVIFQAGNEVPAKNEVDKIDFSRVVVATASYTLALLSLIPFQSSY